MKALVRSTQRTERTPDWNQQIGSSYVPTQTNYTMMASPAQSITYNAAALSNANLT